jgi:putative DNA primase/helicase
MTAAAIAARLGLRRVGQAWRGTCPACGYPSAFALTERDGRPLWWCASCQDGDAIARALKIENRGGTPAKLANPAKLSPARTGGDDPAAAAQRLWASARPIEGTVAETYLAARGLSGFTSPALRYLAEHRHASTGTTWPVLVAAVTDPLTAELRAVHRTYLARDGRSKAPVEPAKMTLGPTAGAVIRLAEPQPGRPLVIGEGIETAASAALILGCPPWAGISASNLNRIKLPPAVVEVVIAADNDPVGQREAERAARRWQAEGRRVRIATPNTAGTDFNDLLQRTGAREVAHGA